MKVSIIVLDAGAEYEFIEVTKLGTGDKATLLVLAGPAKSENVKVKDDAAGTSVKY
jgi:hypothetical protein